jgi:TolB-like protein
MAASLIVMLAAVATAWLTGVLPVAAPAAPRLTIAVLPFAQYSNEESDKLLAARLTDGVTSELARIRSVWVVSRTSARQFAGVRRPLREVAQELNADFVMEGSVLKEGDRVRVDAVLVDAARDRKSWAQDFAGPVSELEELQRRIAAAAAAAAEDRRNR